MLSDKMTQADLALSARGSSSTARGLIGSRVERLPRRLPQEWVAPDREIDEADDYPSGAGLLAMFTAALFGIVMLAALYRFFYDPSSY